MSFICRVIWGGMELLIPKFEKEIENDKSTLIQMHQHIYPHTFLKKKLLRWHFLCRAAWGGMEP